MNKHTEDKLTSKNTRPTSMRIMVYDFLSTQNAALSLAEIEQHFPRADRITIYRTLKTFEEKGIVHSIQENNTTRYKLCNENAHNDWHLHFYCKICKQTTCKENISFSERRGMPFRIDEVRLFAKGICENCLLKCLQ